MAFLVGLLSKLICSRGKPRCVWGRGAQVRIVRVPRNQWKASSLVIPCVRAFGQCFCYLLEDTAGALLFVKHARLGVSVAG